MKVVTKAVLNMHTMQWLPELEESYEYEGPIAKLDRAAQQAAKNAASTATQTGTQYGGEAAKAGAALDPFALNELHAQHLFTPGEMGEQLTAEESGAGAAAGSAAGQLNREAARTRNASGYTKSLQEMARDRMKTAAGAGENLASQDILGAKELQQKGAALLGQERGQDINAQLNAMGQVAPDLSAELAAGRQGWLQNTEGIIDTLKPKA